VRWTKGLKLAKVARRDEQESDCATWLHNARSLPNDQFKREGEKEPLGRNQNRGKLSTSSSIRMLGRTSRWPRCYTAAAARIKKPGCAAAVETPGKPVADRRAKGLRVSSRES
jgi:hypothetical protein